MAKSAEQARRAPALDRVTERPLLTLVMVAEAWPQGAERRKEAGRDKEPGEMVGGRMEEGPGSKAKGDDSAAERGLRSQAEASLPTLSLPVSPVTGMSCGAHCVGYMFLGEVALGREYQITVDKPSLKQPPSGFDSVIARGHTEPGESQEAGQA